MARTHEGYFLIADITGYTRYLNESELEHAQDTLTALLELLVENTQPPLVISRLAGDAVISYGLRERFFHGQTFLEKIENTYVTFRKAIERLVLNNTCQCNACANIGRLDLKFFVHYGTFGIQRIADHDELVGNDVNLLHRLLKNTVTEGTGIRAYALYTEAAVRQLDIPDLETTMTPHREAYEHVGEVAVWVQDMHPVWEKKRSAVAVTFPRDRLWHEDAVAVALPQEQVWDYLIEPEFHHTLIGADRIEVVKRTDGRIAPGSVYQCYHGDRLVPQTILEWQPLHSMLVKELFPMSQAVSFLVEYRLDAVDGGTRLTRTIGQPTGPVPGRMLLRLLMPLFKRVGSRLLASFAARIEADWQAQGGAPGGGAPGDGGAPTAAHIRAAAGAGLQGASSAGSD